MNTRLFSYRLPAVIICLIGFFVWIWLLLYKYYSLGYYDWDFAFFAQAMWSLSHGSAYVSLFDVNFFSNHANLIALVLVPLYKIFPHPFTLLVLKMVSFSVAAYIIYLIAEEKLGQVPALLILILYWLYPGNMYPIVYEFDFENLAPAFIMLVFYFYTKERWAAFLVSSVLLITVKENMPLIIAAFGIHGFFTKPDKIRWGLIPVVLGAVSFYVLAFIFVPLMGGHALGHHPYGTHYADLNSNLLAHPSTTMHHIFTTERKLWLTDLFRPLFLSLLSPGILFLSLPIIMQHFLSSSFQEHTMHYGYMLTIIPFIFLAFINTLDWIKKRYLKAKFYLIFMAFFAFNIFSLKNQMDDINYRYIDYDLPVIKTAPYAWQLLKMVPSQAPVVATFRFLPELSQRTYLYSFHKIYDLAYQTKDHPYRLPANVHYALIDTNDSWLRERISRQSRETNLIIHNFLFRNKWKIKYAASGIALFER